MNNPNPSKRRFQFSLGTLAMGVIATGAFTGMYFNWRENTKLREQLAEAHEQTAYLEIDDPQKAWIRAFPIDEPYQWRFRLYLPNDGKYRFGIQTEEVSSIGINQKLDHSGSVESMTKGEYIVNARIVWRSGDRRVLSLSIGKKGGNSNRSSECSFPRDNNRFDVFNFFPIGDFLCPLQNKKVSFDLDKPFIFLAVKCNKITSETKSADGRQHSISSESTDEPGPGILLWIQEATQKQ
ncbi:MAG TPA: hypothetical protein VKX17_13605 [Planctomycetota bacterium]|nr:hypothetical protein [Planctomycetota bacterium]